jgi:hypothetical protein
MADTAPVHSPIAIRRGEFVVRQFLPTRIERLLLTRLFDLTTGRHVPDERGESPGVALSRSQTVEAVGGRREAA